MVNPAMFNAGEKEGSHAQGEDIHAQDFGSIAAPFWTGIKQPGDSQKHIGGSGDSSGLHNQGKSGGYFMADSRGNG